MGFYINKAIAVVRRQFKLASKFLVISIILLFGTQAHSLNYNFEGRDAFLLRKIVERFWAIEFLKSAKVDFAYPACDAGLVDLGAPSSVEGYRKYSCTPIHVSWKRGKRAVVKVKTLDSSRCTRSIAPLVLDIKHKTLRIITLLDPNSATATNSGPWLETEFANSRNALEAGVDRLSAWDIMIECDA
jgi:hypothetical protein